MDDERDRTPDEWEDAFEAIVDDEGQNPIKFYVHVEPISPEEDVEDVPKYRTLQEAIDAWKKNKEEQQND